MPGTFNGRVAYASIRFTGPGAPEFRMQSGDFASVAMSGSLVRLTFQDEIAPAESCAQLSVRESLGGYARVGTWTNAYVEIQPLDTANAAAELDFDLVILQEATGVPIPAFVPPPPPPPPPGPSLVGLRSWWRADDIAVADGAPVLSWTERTGSGNTLTVPGGVNPPTFRASEPTFNGQPAVDFASGDGLQKLLPSGFSTGFTALAAYVVVQFEPLTGTPTPLCWGDQFAGFVQFYVDTLLGGVWGTIAWGQFAPSQWYSVGTFSTNTVVMAMRNAAGATWDNSSFEINNVYIPATNAPVAPVAPFVPAPVSRVSLGATNNAFWTMRGKIAEVLYYDTEQTPAERAATYSYLQTRYAIP